MTAQASSAQRIRYYQEKEIDMENIYEGKKVFVPGGSGMVGQALCERLREYGADVYVAGLDDESRAPKGTTYYKADLMDLNNCMELCEGMDYVFNMTGAKASQITCRERPGTFFEHSVILAMNMLRAVRAKKVKRYMFTSSYSVYAPAEVFYEDEAFNALPSDNDWGNAWGKRVGELHVEAYRRELKLDNVCIVRPSSGFGPYDIFSEDGMIIPALIYRAVNGQNPLVVWGDGSAVRDIVYSKELARGMMLLMEKMPDKPVNLGSGTGYSVREIAELVVKHVDPSIDLVFDTSKPTGDKKRVMSMERAASYGFHIEIPMDQAIQETVDWYKANREITSDRYDLFATKL